MIFLLILTIFVINAVSQTGNFVVFNANNEGANRVSSHAISQNGSLSIVSDVSAGGQGEGSGIAGPSRAAAQNNGDLVFVVNEQSQTISAFRVNAANGQLSFVRSTTIENPAVTNYDDIAITVSDDDKFVFVGLIDFFDTNKVLSYSVNQQSGELTLVSSQSLGKWLSLFSVRISSLVSKGSFLLVGSTSPGGYLSVYSVGLNGALSQVGSSVQANLQGKSAYYVALNNAGNRLYVAHGNNFPVTISVYSFNGGAVQQALSNPVVIPNSEPLFFIALSQDEGSLYAGSRKSVHTISLDGNGVPQAAGIKTSNSGKGKLGVTGIEVGLCSRVLVTNPNGFELFQNVNNELQLLSSWSVNLPDPLGGASLYERNATCCTGSGPVITFQPEVVIDCAAAIPKAPTYSVNAIGWTQVTASESVGKCNGRPDVKFTVTVSDSCGRRDVAVINYKRVDNKKPVASFVSSNGNSDLYLECGDVLSQNQDFDFISISDDCSPSVASCGSLNNYQRFACTNDKQVGSADINYGFKDSAGNQADNTAKKVKIVDTRPPQFVSLPSAAQVLSNTCDIPANLNPSVIAKDVCSANVVVSAPVSSINKCGVVELNYTARDECNNQATACVRYIVEDRAAAPVIANVADINVELSSDLSKNVINLFEMNALALNQKCNPNFSSSDLFDNEPVVVSVGPKRMQAVPGNFQVSWDVEWVVTYCGNQSKLVQKVVASGSSQAIADSASIAPLKIAGLNLEYKVVSV